MDPQTLLAAVREGATLVVAGLPAGSEFGLDTAGCWVTGPRFMGVKMVPPGAHVLFTAAAPGGVRSARVVHVSPRQVVVALWDAAGERLRLGPGEVDEDEAARYEAAVRRLELDGHLAPYGGGGSGGGGTAHAQQLQEWPRLVSHVTADVLARLQPPVAAGVVRHNAPRLVDASAASSAAAPTSVTVAAAAHLDTPQDTLHQAAMGMGAPPALALAVPTTAGAAASDALANDPRVRALRREAEGADAVADGATDAAAGGPGFLRFTRLPGTGKGADPAAVTAHAVDTSASLQGAADAVARGLLGSGARSAPAVATQVAAHLLGELQLAFALAMTAHSQAGLAAWKALADAVARAEDGALAYCGVSDDGGGSCETPFIADGGAAFLSAALEVLAAQMPLLPADLFAEDGGGGGGGGGGGVTAVEVPPAGGGSDGVAPPAPPSSTSSFLHRAAVEVSRTAARVGRLCGSQREQQAQGATAATATASERYLRAAATFVDACRAHFGWTDVPRVDSTGARSMSGDGGPAAGAGRDADAASDGGVFSSREALLAALAAEAGDYGDEGMPAIVED